MKISDCSPNIRANSTELRRRLRMSTVEYARFRALNIEKSLDKAFPKRRKKS
jgi:hypothetical protein